jgi:L-alanine-DL-glutamate epimerase-like enolase superfamily enzyme
MRNNTETKKIGRRNFIGTLAGASALAGVTGPFDYAMAAGAAVNDGIAITSMYTRQVRPGGIVVRLETNKGIIGYGESRDLDRGARAALNTFGPAIVGMNPTKINDVYNAIMKLYTPPPLAEMRDQEIRGTGAISGIEMACWDILGKVNNVPVYELLGKKLRDQIPMYADTDSNRKADVESRIAKGFRFYKCDMYLSNIARGNTTLSDTPNNYGYREITINKAGLEQMHVYMEQYRETLRSFGEPYASAPIASDHYQGYNATNQISVESAIALANTLKENNGGGHVEDIIDWWVDGCSGAPLKAVNDGTDVPVLTGEDMFGLDQFKKFVDMGAVNFIHPEPNTAGGINQTLLACKYAQTKGVKTFFHNSSGPIAMVAYAHIAACIPDFIAMEYHHMDVPYHDDLVDGVDKPMFDKGVMNVPKGPGLGVTPNEAQFAAHGSAEWTKIA